MHSGQHWNMDVDVVEDRHRPFSLVESVQPSRVLLDGAQVASTSRTSSCQDVYPLLEDETCWLLAIDFDKSPMTF